MMCPGFTLLYFFAELISFQQIESQQYCSYDYLALHDGSDEDAPLMAKICGTKSNKLFFSTGNQVH